MHFPRSIPITLIWEAPPGKNRLPGVENLVQGERREKTRKMAEKSRGLSKTVATPVCESEMLKLTQPEIPWWPALKRVLQNTDGLASLFLRAMADQIQPSRPTCH